MKILHVIAQKPQDTGSGVYVKNLIKQLNGCEQALIAGIDREDEIDTGISFYPVVFRQGKLDFPVVGMSDRMPYESTIYSELNGEKLKNWKNVFRERLLEAKEQFSPDIVVSHHLYLLTSMVKEIFEGTRVVGVCHATDIRQLMTHELEREYIKDQISKLEMVFALHEKQKDQIADIFSVDHNRIEVMGLGYDDEIFNGDRKKKEKKEIWYVGKVAYAKGVDELLEAYEKMDMNSGEVSLKIAGGISGSEGRKLREKAESLSRSVELLGRTEQEQLAEQMKSGHILVLPSYYEGFPMVVIEALASGMTVIINDLPGLRGALGREITESGRVYFLPMPKLEGIDKIDPDHRMTYIDDLCTKLEEVVGSKERKKILNLEKFTWQGVGERYREVIEKNTKRPLHNMGKKGKI